MSNTNSKEGGLTSGISIVVPTHGRHNMIPGLLESLKSACENSGMNCEMLIVDSSDEDAAEIIVKACAQHGAVYIRHEVNNVRQKRNLGIEKARSEIILFVDSDCKASAELIKEHWQTYENGVGGVVGLTTFTGQDSFTWQCIEKTSVLNSFAYARTMEVAPWGPTCNISYRKSVLENIGKFDTAFPFRLGGDDVDLGLRVTDESGLKIKCNPNAVVEHDKQTWNGFMLIGRRLFRWGRMHHHLICKHKKRQMPDLPKTMNLFFLLFIASVIIALITFRPLLLLLPAAWLFLEVIIETVLTERRALFQFHSLASSVGARLLTLVYETGVIFESVNRRNLNSFYTEIYYAPPSPSSSGRQKRITQIWANLLALVALILIVSLI